MQIKITVRYYLTPIIKKTEDSDWWGCGETGSGCVLFLLVGMQIGTATMENSMEAPQTVKDRTAVAFSTPTFGYISQENENTFFVCFWTIVHLQCCISFGYTTNGSYIYMEEKMATHSSILAWEVPWTEELCGLQSVGSQRVRRGWSDLAWMHAVSLMLSERIWRARGMDISFLKFRFSIKIFDFCYWQQTLSVNFPWHSFFVKMSAQYLSLSKHSLSVITCPSKNGDPWKTQLVQLIS